MYVQIHIYMDGMGYNGLWDAAIATGFHPQQIP